MRKKDGLVRTTSGRQRYEQEQETLDGGRGFTRV